MMSSYDYAIDTLHTQLHLPASVALTYARNLNSTRFSKLNLSQKYTSF